MSITLSRTSFDRPLAETDRRSPGYVSWLQAALNRANGAGLTVDGNFGPRTRQAVQAFQRQRGLVADGIVGARTEAALIAAGAPAPPGRGASPINPTPLPKPTLDVPVLLGTETLPPGKTIYTGITLGGEAPARPMTGIYIPDGYRPVKQVDLILYLHGHKERFPTVAIDAYWNRRRFSTFALRESTNESSKNVILVAPTLGPGSQAGWLTGPGGLDRYVDQVLATLHTHGPNKGDPTRPTLGNLILACHSGGGVPMRRLALSSQRSSAAIRECWGFDCLYNRGDDTEWARWAKSRPDARLYVHYLGTTVPLSRALNDRAVRESLANVSVARSTGAQHNDVPLAHWRARIEACTFLSRR